jgi:hypothetical protein
MTPTPNPSQEQAMTELDEIIETFVTDQHTCEIGLLPCTYCDAKTALTQLLQAEIRKARNDGAIYQLKFDMEAMRNSVKLGAFMRMPDIDFYEQMQLERLRGSGGRNAPTHTKPLQPQLTEKMLNKELSKIMKLVDKPGTGCFSSFDKMMEARVVGQSPTHNKTAPITNKESK